MEPAMETNPQQWLLSLVEQFVTGIFHLEKSTTQGYRKPLISFECGSFTFQVKSIDNKEIVFHKRRIEDN